MAGRSRDDETAIINFGSHWDTYVASAKGADHIRIGSPNEDSVGAEQFDLPGGRKLPVFAVADGHGHSRHFRSARGSKLAVTAATSTTRVWAAALPPGAQPSAAAASELVSRIVARWLELVAADVADDPITEAQRTAMLPNDPDEIAYGSTLLLGAIVGEVAVLGQIGDGEMLLVLPDGRELAPIPTDSRLDGTKTTSLCQPDAVSSFRVALVSLAKTPVFCIFASTDGYSNAQASNNWRQTLSADLVRLGLEHGTAWIGSQLDTWAAACASSNGSGDDSTVALAINTDVALSHPAAGQRPAVSNDQDTTLIVSTGRSAGRDEGATLMRDDRPGPADTAPAGYESVTRPAGSAAPVQADGRGAAPAAALTVPVQFARPAAGGPPGPGDPAGVGGPGGFADPGGPAGPPQGAPAGLAGRRQLWLGVAAVVLIAVVAVVFFVTRGPSSPHPTAPMPSASPSPGASLQPTATPSAHSTSGSAVNPASPGQHKKTSIPTGLPTSVPTSLPGSAPTPGAADELQSGHRDA